MKKIVSITMFIIFILCFGTITVSADEGNVTEETTDTIESSLFIDFVEIDKGTFLDYLENKKLTSVVHNINTKEYYAITADNEKIWFFDEDNDVGAYLILKGIDVKKANIIRPATNEQIEANKANNDIGFACLATLIIITAVIVLTVKKQKDKTFVPVNGTDNKPTIKKEEVPTIKFSDVEGVEGLKNDVMRVVDALKNPAKYEAMGARPTKGIILYGPPGTGKTLLAKAIAGEAGVPFFSAVGSDFVEKYVGVGASRVRELYKKARKSAPCIVFIDEVDAVAAQRGQDNNSEADQTINALLAELDGFTVSDGIVTICATNRLDLLDSAFKRAGRFDLKLAVGLPDKNARLKILQIHGKNKKFAESVNLDTVACKTVGFSGAELESLLNEAALIAVDNNKTEITNEDVDDAFFKIVMQGNKKKREEIDETTRVIAWHEAGHTLATKLLTDDEVSSVTIIGSTSGAGGVTFRNPKESILQSKQYLKNSIMIMYAGRAAEQLFFNDDDKITTGASQDIRQATQIIKEYLGYYGMGDLGMIDVSQFKRDFDDIIQEASKMSKALYDETLTLLSDNKDILVLLANTLLEKETLVESEIDKIVKIKT